MAQTQRTAKRKDAEAGSMERGSAPAILGYLESRRIFRIDEKSPVRIAAVGTVAY